MTVETTDSRAQYATNATTGPWTVPFYFLADDHIEVIYTDSAGNETTLTLTTDYSVSGAGDPTGGTVTTVAAYAAGGYITVLRSIDPLQQTDWVDGDASPAASYERAVDLLTMLVQQQAEVLARALIFAPSDTEGSTLPAVALRADKTLSFDSLGRVSLVAPASGSAAALAVDLASSVSALKNAGQVGFNPALAYAVGTAGAHMLATANVKDFGAIGTAAGAAANEAADTIAFALAKAAAANVIVPEGTYYLSGVSAGHVIGPGCGLIGAGTGKTKIYYSGVGNGIYMGAPGNIALAYDCALRGITLYCTNRASTVNGVYGENLVHFTIDDVTAVGSGDPNSGVPADTVLYGSGYVLTNNSIIGRMSRCSARIWNFGAYFKTLVGSQSYWSAAIEVSGQGEFSNNMYGIVVGDPTVAFYSGAGCSFRDLTLQGNYTEGMRINAGDNTTVETCYFEGNANYDVVIGTAAGAPTPLCVKLINNRMDSESIGTTAYGTFPYLAKVHVVRGTFTTIDDNDMSVSTAIPLVILDALADQTRVLKNRLNSGTAATMAARMTDNGTGTITRDNQPERAFVKAGTFSRALDGASGGVAYTGVGFRPTSIEFTAAVDSTNEFCIGFADASGGRCLNSDAAGAKLSSAHAIRIIRDAAGKEQSAVLASFDADGFTLTWTKTGAPPANTLTINYVARR